MKKQVKIFKVFFALVSVALMFFCSLPVMAGGISSSSSSSSSSSISNVVDSKGFEVTGYKLSHGTSAENYTGEIHRYYSLTVILYIRDTRENVAMGLKPTGRLNTDSFTIPTGNEANNGIGSAETATSIPNGMTYELIFENMTYTGIGKTFRCDIFYENQNSHLSNIPMQTYELTINQCVEYVAPSSSESSAQSSSALVKGTGFVLKEASYGQTQIFAGQPFTLSVTLLATNGDHSVENVTVGITPAKELSLLDGSSLVYIGTVKPGQNIPASFKLMPAANVEEGSFSAVIDVKGVDSKTGTAVSAQASISIPVVQPERFEIFSAQMPTEITAGMDDGTGFGTVTLVNQGKGTVGNVSVDIMGEGISTDEGKQYIGHVAGGEQKGADFNIMAETPGTVQALVLVSYESTSGEKKELTYEFTINVLEGMPSIEGEVIFPDMELPAEKKGMPIWGWVLIALGLVAAVVVVILLARRKKAKKAALLLDDMDEDE